MILYSLVFTPPGVSNDSPEYGSEVAHHGECVVHTDSCFVVPHQHFHKVESEDGFHSIVGEPLTQLIQEDEPDTHWEIQDRFLGNKIY